jgi:hypothetical protein
MISDIFTQNLLAIEKLAQSNPGPFIAGVYRSGVKPLK